MNFSLLDKRQDVVEPAAGLRTAETTVRVANPVVTPAPSGKMSMSINMTVDITPSTEQGRERLQLRNGCCEPPLVGENHFGAGALGSFAYLGRNNLLVTSPEEDPLVYLSVEVGESCQLNCRHCIYHRNESAPEPSELVRDRIEEAIRCTPDQYGFVSFAGKEPTLYPIVTRGNLQAVLFNQHKSPQYLLRISNDGLVFLSCDHLTLSGDVSGYGIGNLRHESLDAITRRVLAGEAPLMRALRQVPRDCVQCTQWNDCRGGDRLSGLYFDGVPSDPYCTSIERIHS